MLEVMRYQKHDGEIVVMSGFGRRSDWYLNIQASTPTRVVIGKESFAASIVTYQRRRPSKAWRTTNDALATPLHWCDGFGGRLAGWSYDGSEENRKRLVRQCPLVVFTPASPPS